MRCRCLFILYGLLFLNVETRLLAVERASDTRPNHLLIGASHQQLKNESGQQPSQAVSLHEPVQWGHNLPLFSFSSPVAPMIRPQYYDQISPVLIPEGGGAYPRVRIISLPTAPPPPLFHSSTSLPVFSGPPFTTSIDGAAFYQSIQALEL